MLLAVSVLFPRRKRQWSQCWTALPEFPGTLAAPAGRACSYAAAHRTDDYYRFMQHGQSVVTWVAAAGVSGLLAATLAAMPAAARDGGRAPRRRPDRGANAAPAGAERAGGHAVRAARRYRDRPARPRPHGLPGRRRPALPCPRPPGRHRPRAAGQLLQGLQRGGRGQPGQPGKLRLSDTIGRWLLSRPGPGTGSPSATCCSTAAACPTTRAARCWTASCSAPRTRSSRRAG